MFSLPEHIYAREVRIETLPSFSVDVKCFLKRILAQKPLKTIRSAGSGSAATPENSGNFLSTKTAKKNSAILRAKNFFKKTLR